MQAIRQRETFRVGRVNDILEWSRIPFYIGCTANGIVVEGKHTDAVIDYIAGIAGHSDDFAQQVVDIGIIGTPLDAVDAIPGFEAVQGLSLIHILLLLKQVITSYWDPAFYVEGDNLYMYYGCSPVDPIYAQVLDLNTLEARTEVITCFNSNKEEYGLSLIHI